MSDSKKTGTSAKESTSRKEDKSKNDSEQTKGNDGKTLPATQVVDLGFLEADDDFEEFPAEEWKDKSAAMDGFGEADEEDAERVNIWEDNWDDDNIEEDFSKQLKAELEKRNLTSNAAQQKVR